MNRGRGGFRGGRGGGPMRPGMGRGGPGGAAKAKAVVEPHRHKGVFISKGKRED